MNTNHPSLIRILVTDYPAFFAWLLPLIGWGFMLFDLVRGQKILTNFLLGWSVLTLVAVVVLLWRIISIYTVFNEAQEVNATITGVSFFRDRGTISFIYNYQNGKWTSSNYVLKNKRTSKFTAGDSVTVLVDRNRPKKAYIMEIFQ